MTLERRGVFGVRHATGACMSRMQRRHARMRHGGLGSQGARTPADAARLDVPQGRMFAKQAAGHNFERRNHLLIQSAPVPGAHPAPPAAALPMQSGIWSAC